jgi:hypothetical protein
VISATLPPSRPMEICKRSPRFGTPSNSIAALSD